MAIVGAHPHFEDNGAVAWFRTFADALAAARAERKKVFIDFGREA